MKRRSRSIWLMGATELWSLSEKGIENLLVKVEKTTDMLLEKLTEKRKKQVKKKTIQRELFEKIEQRDAEIHLANLTAEKSKNQNTTKTRLNEFEKTGVGKELESQYEP